MKHSLHYWYSIIKFIIIAYYMQYTYFVQVKDQDTTQIKNINKCLQL